MTTERQTITVREMAAILGCTENAIYKRVDRGAIPEALVLRQGRKIEFRRAAVERWLGLAA